MTPRAHIRLDLAVHVVPILAGIVLCVVLKSAVIYAVPVLLLSWIVSVLVLYFVLRPQCPKCTARLQTKTRHDYRIGCGFSRGYYHCKACGWRLERRLLSNISAEDYETDS